MINLTAPQFLVVESTPRYHPIYDGVCGSNLSVVDAGSEAFAKASAVRRTHELQSQGYDEVSYYVVKLGNPLHQRWTGSYEPFVPLSDDMPF